MNIITLSTIPPRFSHLGPTLKSLLSQDAPIDRIIVHVPRSYRRFPDHDGSLPDLPDGVEAALVDQDFGPATKVLPAIRAYQGQDVNILFCDDDLCYPKTWASGMLDAARAHPGCAINAAVQQIDAILPDTPYRGTRMPRAVGFPKRKDLSYRLKRIAGQLTLRHLYRNPHKPVRKRVLTEGYTDTFQGYAGVLVRPEFFDDAVFDIPEQLWAVDDIWMSGHLARRDIPIWATALPTGQETRAVKTFDLTRATIDGLDRDAANAACVRYFQDRYGIWS